MKNFIQKKISLMFVILFFILMFKCNSNIKKGTTAKTIFCNIERWESIESDLIYKSTLLLKPDNSFTFFFEACISKGFSKGTWIKDGNNIILNSSIINSCYYISNFGEEWFNIYDTNGIKRKTTIDRCIPISNIEYVVFNNDSFYKKNDTLFYRNKKNVPYTVNNFIKTN